MGKFLFLLSLFWIASLASSCSEEKYDDPDVPQNLTATAGNGENTITWDAVTSASKVNIYWDIQPDVTKSDNKISNVTKPYTHKNLTNEITYYYVATGESWDKETKVSNEVSATPQQ